MSLDEKPLDPRVVRTRQLITDAFMELLGEKTLNGMTVGDITKKARVNRTTFYSHFYDKYALFNQVVHTTFVQALRRHLPENAPYSPENVKALVLAVCEYFTYLNSQCPRSDRELRPVAETAVQAVVRETLRSWMHRRSDAEDVDLVISYLSWAIFGVGLEWIGNGSEQAVEETAADVCVLVDRTLSSEGGFRCG